jgi:Fe-S cluster assembly protein SufD
MTTTTKKNILDSLLSQLPIRSSFSDLRKSSQDSLESKGLPTAKDEEYKFTSITKRLENSITEFAFAKKVSLSKEIIQSNLFEGFDGDLLVFNNGTFEHDLSSVSSNGYTFSLLSDANPELLGKIAKRKKTHLWH